MFGTHYNQQTIKYLLRGPMGSRAEAVKQYKWSESKQNKEIQALKKKNKMLYSITKKYGSRRETNNIKKIRAKASKKRRGDSSNYSSGELDSDS